MVSLPFFPCVLESHIDKLNRKQVQWGNYQKMNASQSSGKVSPAAMEVEDTTTKPSVMPELRFFTGDFFKSPKTAGYFTVDSYNENIQVSFKCAYRRGPKKATDAFFGQQEDLQTPNVQNMQYLITTSVLCTAVFVAANSSYIPTGMAQVLFGNIISFHVICRVAVRISKLSTEGVAVDYGFQAIAIVVLLIWSACLLISCMWIELAYTVVWTSNADTKAVMSLIVIFHGFFWLGTVAQVALNYMNQYSKKSLDLAFGFIHMVLNTVFVFIISCLAFNLGNTNGFSAPHCTLWGF